MPFKGFRLFSLQRFVLLLRICFPIFEPMRLGIRGLVRSFWSAEMPQGKIKRLVVDRGFGFVEGERGDLFFHHSEIQGVRIEELREGQELEYEVGQGQKGPCATNLRLVN